MHVCLWFTWVDRPEHQPGRTGRPGAGSQGSQGRPGQVGQPGQPGQAQPGRAARAGRRGQVVQVVPCLVDITQLQLTARGGNTSLMTRLTSILLTKFCQYN